MASNSFGQLFRMTTFGESHGPAIGVVIDGCPAGLPLTGEEIDEQLARRRPGRGPYTSPRAEEDRVELLSGLFEGKTTGAPIALLIRNRDADSSQYEAIKGLYRPGHANFTYLQKYGLFDPRGGGRSSARETAARVAAGAVAKKLLAHFEIDAVAFVSEIGGIAIPDLDLYRNGLKNRLLPRRRPDFEPGEAGAEAAQLKEFSDGGGLKSSGWPTPAETDFSGHFGISDLRKKIDSSPIFCPCESTAEKMMARILEVKEEGDSLGGIIACAVRLPAGLGDPIYAKLEALLAFAMLSLPATTGFEIGAGFAAARMKGSEHNAPFDLDERGQVYTAAGTLGGISTGAPLLFRVAFKPTSSIKKPQATVSFKEERATFQLPAEGRHDPCVAIRAAPVVEAMAALVLADALLMNRCSKL